MMFLNKLKIFILGLLLFLPIVCFGDDTPTFTVTQVCGANTYCQDGWLNKPNQIILAPIDFSSNANEWTVDQLEPAQDFGINSNYATNCNGGEPALPQINTGYGNGKAKVTIHSLTNQQAGLVFRGDNNGNYCFFMANSQVGGVYYLGIADDSGSFLGIAVTNISYTPGDTVEVDYKGQNVVCKVNETPVITTLLSYDMGGLYAGFWGYGTNTVQLSNFSVCAADTETGTFTETATETPTISTSTATKTTTNTNTPIPPTSTRSATATQTNTSTNTSTATHTNTTTETATRTATYTNTITSTNTATATQTLTQTNTKTATNTYTQTRTATQTNTATNTSTQTQTATQTNTSKQTNTRTQTATQTNTVTKIPTATYTFTSTNTDTSTGTATSTSTQTATFTWTPSNTKTFTKTYTATYTTTYTFTFTQTFTPQPTASVSTFKDNDGIRLDEFGITHITYHLVTISSYPVGTTLVAGVDGSRIRVSNVEASAPIEVEWTLVSNSGIILYGPFRCNQYGVFHSNISQPVFDIPWGQSLLINTSPSFNPLTLKIDYYLY